MATPQIGQELIDTLESFEQGMNSGVVPPKLPANQLSFATNATVRGLYVKPRPRYRQITLQSDSELTRTNFETKLWQGGCYYKADDGTQSLMAAIGGRLFQVTPNSDGLTATVVDRTIPGDPNPADRPQAWLWQAEKWVIWNDGISLPVFFDGTTSRRSNGNVPPSPPSFPDILPQTWTIPAAGNDTTALQTDGDYSALVGNTVTIQTLGIFTVKAGTATTATFTAINPTLPGGHITPALAPNPWPVKFYGSISFTPELPPGRMGVYGMGRNWVCLVDGKQFIASDLVGGSSGTFENNYRDAVLKITENAYLASGGNFTVPGSVGDIRAMRFTATLDASLGQGPLQILTANTIFSCQAPVDRTLWTNLTNPILTQSLITNGGLGQNSSILANGDLIFRSIDGIRSLILARRDFATWGNVPISREVSRILDPDQKDLLAYGSAVVFGNRLLMTCAPTPHDQGVYHRGTVALNFDPLSTLRGKLPSVYDGLWTGLNVLQYIADEFGGRERAFAFGLNTVEGKIELWEILSDDDPAIYDESGPIQQQIPVIWAIESPVLFKSKERLYVKLSNGELSIDDMRGRVDFRVYYRPDEYPCWIPWQQWSECATDASTQTQYRPRLGFGTPNGNDCDSTIDRPQREGYNFQVKIVLQGQARITGMRFLANVAPQPKFAPSRCPCPPEAIPPTPDYKLEDGYLSLNDPNSGRFLFFGLDSDPAQSFVDEERVSKAKIEHGYLWAFNPTNSQWYAVQAIEDPPQLMFTPEVDVVPIPAAVPGTVRTDHFRIRLFNPTTMLWHRLGIAGAPPQLFLSFLGEH